MPITTIASYVPTMNEFLAHWAQVDTALSTTLTVVLPSGSGVARTDFLAFRDSLEAQAAAVIDALNDVEIAKGTILLQKQAMLTLLNEFTGLLDGYYSGTAFILARPNAPSLTDGQERFLAQMRDAASLWPKLNAAAAPAGVTLPLALSDGTTAAAFQAKVVALQAAFATEATAAQALTLSRAARGVTMDNAYEAMKAYRKVVPSRCRQNPTLVETLPALTPTGGHTPEAVNASATFEAPDKAKVVYEASTDADLARYELRGNPGSTYREDDAVVVQSHVPADALEFVSTFGLTQPGATVALKVYVVLTTGNEAGSAAMTVSRPL